MNDPENVVFKREKEKEFVKSYDEITTQLEKIKKEREFLKKLKGDDLVTILGNQPYLLNVVEFVLLWMLNNDGTDILPFEFDKEGNKE